MTTPPTERQLLVLRIIAGSIKKHGTPPTLREIASALGASSTTGALDHVKLLLQKGLLTRKANSARSLVLTTAGLRAIGDRGQAELGAEVGLRAALLAEVQRLEALPAAVLQAMRQAEDADGDQTAISYSRLKALL